MDRKKNKAIDRFLPIGGIAAAYSLFASKKTTLEKIASSLNCSRETVRQDFISLFGINSYKETIKKRLGKKNSPAKTIFPSFAAINKFLQDESCVVFSKEQIKNFKFISSLLEQNIPSASSIYLNSNNIIIDFENFQICTRIGVVHERLRDFPTGYYRFKISQKIQKYEFCIFCVVNENKYFIYIFPTKEILGLKSLALRFKEPIRTDRKYSPYFNNWALLSSKGGFK